MRYSSAGTAKTARSRRGLEKEMEKVSSEKYPMIFTNPSRTRLIFTVSTTARMISSFEAASSMPSRAALRFSRSQCSGRRKAAVPRGVE